MSVADRGPNVRVPPPFVFVGGWVVAWLLSFVRVLEIDSAGASVLQTTIGSALFAAGLGLMAWGLVTFRRARTPIVPVAPARLVVTDGPYRFTRNPMYLGLTAGYAGLAVVLNLLWPVVLLPGVLIVLTVAVIDREEAHLARAFGDEYDRYRQRVRRWI